MKANPSSRVSPLSPRGARVRGIGLAFRMAFRGLVRTPGTSFLAVSVLTLGLAAPVIFFSILAGTLRPLPVPGGSRVIRMEVSQPATGGVPVSVTLQDLELLRGAGSVESLGAYRIVGGTLVDPQRAAARISAAFLTPEVLPLLRTEAALGRIPAPEEAETGLLLGFEVWQEAYEGDPSVLGRGVLFNGEPRVITGVLPEGFGFPLHQNAWALLKEDSEDQDPIELVGRLAEGVSLDAASVELAGRWARGDGLRETSRRGGVVEVDSFTGGRGERGEGIAFLGLVLVALALLFIACANVANLLLVRATDRIRSLGVQSALGAGRAQLSAQLFLEALLLAVVGGVGGLLLAWVGVDSIQRALAAEHFGYFWMRMAVDGRVVVFASILVGGTAVFAGTLPILRILRADLQGVLKAGGGDGMVGGGGSWSRGFVTTQLALSCAALVAAGLTGQSLAMSGDFGRGVPAGEILVASLDPGDASSPSDPEWGGRLVALNESLAAMAGARAAALALGAPGYFEPWGRFELEGGEVQRAQDRHGVLWNAVTPGFFSLLDLEVRRGRGLEEDDDGRSPPVAVVNEAFAARHLPGEEAVGRRLRVLEADSATLFTVVGVVEDVDMGGGPSTPNERVYLSLQQVPRETVLALVRSGSEPTALTPDLRRVVAGVDPGIPLWSVRTLADAHAFMIRVPRGMAALAMAGGLGGLLVAAVGLYGLLAFRVRQRRRELGVRLALGADGRRLAGEVLKLALRQLLPALGIGLLLAWLVSPVLGVVLLGLNPRSPTTYLGVAAAFIAVGFAAAMIPARRAAAVDPAEVLRGE
jgi:putative ABC transport system permease protein